MSNPTDSQIKAIENVIAVIESIRKNLGTGTWSQIYVAMANLIEPEYQIALDNVVQALKETAVTLKNQNIQNGIDKAIQAAQDKIKNDIEDLAYGSSPSARNFVVWTFKDGKRVPYEEWSKETKD